MEYGIYLNYDGTYWEMDGTGFHPYIPKDPVPYIHKMHLECGGLLIKMVDDDIFFPILFYRDGNGNYWVHYGDRNGYVPYSPEMDELVNGYYQDENGDYWEQSDRGLSRYTPKTESPPDGYYQNNAHSLNWVKNDNGFRQCTG